MRNELSGCRDYLMNASDKEVTTMPDVISRVMKINIRARSKEKINTLGKLI